MKKIDPKPLKTALEKVEHLKVEIAKKRDELREAIAEVEEIAESLDQALDGLEDGKRGFERAVESMSQYL